jgi:hypothetical protein
VAVFQGQGCARDLPRCQTREVDDAPLSHVASLCSVKMKAVGHDAGAQHPQDGAMSSAIGRSLSILGTMTWIRW